MITYVVFAMNVPLDVAPPDPCPAWSVITQAVDEAQAVDKVVTAGALPPQPTVHVCDIANTMTFEVTTDVAVKESETSSYFQGEALPIPEPPEPAVPPNGAPKDTEA
jgi:hypothetical protein